VLSGQGAGGVTPATLYPLTAALQQLRLRPGGALVQPSTPAPGFGETYIAATHLWVVPCEGNAIGLWDGSAWTARATGGIAINLALSPRTAGLPFDVFLYWDGSAVQADLVDWATINARAVGLLTVDGVYVSGADTTRRYLGTAYARTATTYDWVPLADTVAQADARLDVWNAYHRRSVGWRLYGIGGSWTQGPGPIAWRLAGGGAGYHCYFVAGLEEDRFSARLQVASESDLLSYRAAAIGFNNDGAPGPWESIYQSVSPVQQQAHGAAHNQIPPAGINYVSWMERVGNALATVTWAGNSTNDWRLGMEGDWRC
jgi:hypothetical protein